MIKTAITYQGPAGKKIKGFKSAVKNALFDAIRAWHHGKLAGSTDGGYLKYHFTEQALYRYAQVYRRRSRGYQNRQRKKFGRVLPLTWSGKTKSEVTRTISVSGTSKNASGRMTGSNRALNYGGRPGMPDMRAELLAVNEQEAQALAEFVDEVLSKFSNGESETETIQI